jgi:hypothetical protein
VNVVLCNKTKQKNRDSQNPLRKLKTKYQGDHRTLNLQVCEDPSSSLQGNILLLQKSLPRIQNTTAHLRHRQERLNFADAALQTNSNVKGFLLKYDVVTDMEVLLICPDGELSHPTDTYSICSSRTERYEVHNTPHLSFYHLSASLAWIKVP